MGKAGHGSHARTGEPADSAIANEEDIQMTLGIQADVDVHFGHLDRPVRGADRQSVGAIPELESDWGYLARIPQHVAQRMVGRLA